MEETQEEGGKDGRTVLLPGNNREKPPWRDFPMLTIIEIVNNKQLADNGICNLYAFL